MKTMASSMAIPMATEGNLSRYLQDIRKFPMLSAEEELSLARRWRDSADEPAAHKLVTSHLRLVAKIAMGANDSHTLKVLRKIKYDGVCSLEYEKDMDKPLAGITESINYFRKVMDETR